MSDIYTISLEDQVTGNAYRMAKAYVDVSTAAQYFARSVKSLDKDMIELDRHQLKMARTQLMAARAAQSAGNALGKLGPKQSQAASTANKLSTAHNTGAQSSRRFSYALNALSQASMNLAFSLAGRLIGAVVDTGKGLYDVADLATRAHMSFANFFGGQANGDRMLKESIDIAKRYGFTIADTVAQVQRFGAAGFNTEQSKGLLRFGADMMAAGRSVQDVKGIFLAMTQIQGKGKLQAEELTQQLAERGINAGRVWEILAKKFKTTKEGVMKMQKAGKIGPGAALNAIVQAGVEGVRGNAIGEAGKQVADATVGGLARKMSTEVEAQIFQAVDNATPRLVGGMQAIFAGLTGIEGGKLQDSLTNMLNGVGDFMGKVGPQLPAMAEAFTTAFGAASGFDSTSLDSFAKQLPKMASDLGTIAGLFVTIASMAAKIAGFAMGSSAKDMNAHIAKVMGPGNGQLVESEGKKSALDLWTENQENGGLLRTKASDVPAIDGLDFGAASATGVGAAVGGLPSPMAIGPAQSSALKKAGDTLAEQFVTGVEHDADLGAQAISASQDALFGAEGLKSSTTRNATAVGGAAGASVRSSKSTRVTVGDINLGGSGGQGADQAEQVREYLEGDFVEMLERHGESVGAD